MCRIQYLGKLFVLALWAKQCACVAVYVRVFTSVPTMGVCVCLCKCLCVCVSVCMQMFLHWVPAKDDSLGTLD